ncbi:hypothetical protein Rhe02_48560 [Rhizocola hellebori]|uniref:Uncharacterized protein n=1 Tax=Rhizocola hellebori TaxID=1392758 RepID=A0A8J3VGX0_9ACTN|nr:hypothetical protein [Rhizocola hellebori]GIH06789.1 hypothetical protein Rhe02_48560 [Rhizocola hellebori]
MIPAAQAALAKPRGRVPRVLLAGAIVVIGVAGWLMVKRFVVLPLAGNGPLADFLGAVFPVLFTGFLAARVSYRWVHGLYWLMPPLGIYFLSRVAWRLSLLPHRDWPDRR